MSEKIRKYLKDKLILTGDEDIEYLACVIYYLEKELRISRALEARFFPQVEAYKLCERFDMAGFGNPYQESPYGNTLIGMSHRCLDENKSMKDLIKQLMNDLPSNKDWLDPDLELQLKNIIKKGEE